MIAASAYSDAIPMGEEESSLAIDLADTTEPEIRETGSEHAYFRMDFYLMDDQLRCRFYTTPDKKDDGLLFYGFEVVDNVTMREYIRNHLPENLRKKLEQKSRLPEPVAVAVPKTALPLTRAEPAPVSAKSGTVLPAPALIERIVITQARQKIEIKLPHRVASKEPARLVRGLPWSLGMTVELDRAPAANELSALRKSYSITTCLIQLQRMRRFPSTTVELNLAPGKKQYESEITSRGLEPGRYALDIKTVVPFLLKDERKTLELVVQ